MYKEDTKAGESQGTEVRHLQAVLEQETKTRQQQQVFNSKLQEEYDVLLKKLAAAELHIDRLRLRANVDVNKRFILSHDSIQSCVLQQGLHTKSSPAQWEEGGAGRATSTGTDGGYWKSEGREMPGSPHSPNSGREHGLPSVPMMTPVAIQGYNSLPPDNHVSPSHQHVLSKQHGFVEEPHVQRNTSQSLLQDFEGHDDSANSVQHLILSQALSETQSETLSQMSTGYIKTQASAESQHLSQIFKIRSLQEQIASLKDKLNGNQGSFDELSEDLGRILEEHEALTGNFALSGQQLEALQERYKDKASREISQRKVALENEVSWQIRGIQYLSS